MTHTFTAISIPWVEQYNFREECLLFTELFTMFHGGSENEVLVISRFKVCKEMKSEKIDSISVAN